MYTSQSADTKGHRYKRSRLIKEMATNLNRNEDSIASSTGSAHGTVSSEGTLTESMRQEESLHEIPKFDYSDDSDSYGFHPGRDGAINSTGALDISYSDMKRMLRDKDAKNKSQKQKLAKQQAERENAQLPELRATAKKYGKWSPNKGQLSYVIDTSAIGKVFPDFSGGLDSDDDVSRDLGHLRQKHSGNDILVFQDVPGHPDSPKVTINGMQVTATPSQAHIDKMRSLPLQNATKKSLNQRQHHTGSDYSVGLATKNTNIRQEVVVTKLTKHRTTNSTDTIEIERNLSPSKYTSHTSRSLDTAQIEQDQAPFEHFKRRSLPNIDDLSIQDISYTGNKENIVPKSSPLPKANTMSPPRPAVRGSVKSRFQARVRDEFESSRLSIGSQHDNLEDQQPQNDLSVLSAHSTNHEGSFVSLRSAANNHKDNTYETVHSMKDQEELSGSVIINRTHKDTTVESMPSNVPEEEEALSILTDVVLQGSAIAPIPVVERSRDVTIVLEDAMAQDVERQSSGVSGGTVVHKTTTRTRNNWSSRVQSNQSPARKTKSMETRQNHAAEYMTPNLTVMSFIAPFRVISSPIKASTQELGLPSIKDGRVLRRNQANLDGGFDPIAAFRLPDDEEDIYQMCESQKVRIAVLEEERMMQNDLIKSLQQQMAVMKAQLAETSSSSEQKWKSHKCVDTKLQENFTKLQTSTNQIRYECNTLKKENLELKLAKHELETHQCIDTELELENAQLRADVKTLEEERDGHKCIDEEMEEENERLRADLNDWKEHVCRNEKLEKEVKLLREFKEGILGVVKERGVAVPSPRR